MEEASVSTFDCPQCGAENPLASGARFLACVFCDTTLFLDRSAVVGHFRLPRLFDQGQAVEALNRWMSGNETVRDLDRKSALAEVEPLTFPMWLFRCREGGAETVVVEPAAPTPIAQLADLELPAGKLEPYTPPNDGSATVAASVPLATARGWLEDRGLDDVVEVALVEIPLWRARYSYEGRDYQALVEGSTGRVLASVFPEKAESPYILVAIAGLMLFGIEGLLIGNLFLKLVVYALTGIPLVLIAYWVARKI